MMQITFTALGGATDIGANCYYLCIDGTGIILDAGMDPRKTGYDALPDFSLLTHKPVDYCLISHAHHDHIGALPYLVQHFPYIKIITTPQTRQILRYVLHNQSDIMEGQYTEKPLRIYTRDEIDLLVSTIDFYPYRQPFAVNGYRHRGAAPLMAEFYYSGHILGGAGILLSYNGFRIFFTGDINTRKQQIMLPAELPAGSVDVLITECTNGGGTGVAGHTWGDEKKRLAAATNKVLAKGGSVLLPVFALGKTQEMLAIYNELMRKGKVPKSPIFTGGLARKINKLYDRNRYVTPMQDIELELCAVPQHPLRGPGSIRELFKDPSVVLAPGGMMNAGTASNKFGKLWLERENAAIFTVGYMDEDSPGYLISRAKKGDMLQLSATADPIRVRCDIVTFRFSAHAPAEGLLATAAALRPAKILLVHGEEISKRKLGAALLQQHTTVKLFSCEEGKELQLL